MITNDGKSYESYEKSIKAVEFAEMHSYVQTYLNSTYIIAYFQGNINPSETAPKETMDRLTTFYFKNSKLEEEQLLKERILDLG